MESRKIGFCDSPSMFFSEIEKYFRFSYQLRVNIGSCLCHCGSIAGLIEKYFANTRFNTFSNFTTLRNYRFRFSVQANSQLICSTSCMRLRFKDDVSLFAQYNNFFTLMNNGWLFPSVKSSTPNVHMYSSDVYYTNNVGQGCICCKIQFANKTHNL